VAVPDPSTSKRWPFATGPEGCLASTSGAGRSLALLVAILLAPASAQAADGSPTASRFRLEAELRPLAVSACGRFALDAQARLAPEAKSADGRFTLKAVHVPAVGCDPFPDPLFADGFENP
jgi:hypothetical protein